MKRTGIVSFGLAWCLALTACGSRLDDSERQAALAKVASVSHGPAAPAAPGGADASPAPAEATAGGPAASTDVSSGGAPAGAGSAAGGTAVSPSAGAATGAATKRGTAAGGPSSAAAGGAAKSPAGAPVPPKPGDQKPAAQGGAATVAPVKGSDLVLGSFGVESGVLGALTASMPVATRAWAADVNRRGGINGHAVRVVMGDDGGDPARAQAIVRRMVEQDRIVAIFSEYSVGTLSAVVPYLKEKSVPVLGVTGADPLADHSEIVFNPVMGADVAQSWGMALILTSQTDKKKVGLIYCREVPQCKNLVDNFKKILPQTGLEVVDEAQVSLAQPDYTAEALGAQRAGAEIVMTILDPTAAIRYAKAAHRQGYRPVIAGIAPLNTAQLLTGGPDVEGVLTISRAGGVWQTSPKMKPYRDAIARYQPGGAMSTFGAEVFVAARLLEEKVGPFLKEPPSSANVFEGLYSLKGETLDGLLPGITFPRGDDRTGVNQCLVPTRVSGGKFVSWDGQDTFVCAPGWKPQG